MSIGAVNAQTWNIGTPTATAVTATLTGTAPNQTLTISGTGKMQDFANGSSCPWYNGNFGITTLVIQNGVTNIGNYAFYGCTGITGNLTIPSSVTTIGNYAFTSLWSITGNLAIPNSVTKIGDYAFASCNQLTSLTIPNSVTSIGDYAFASVGSTNGLVSITCQNLSPSSITLGGSNVFYNINKTTCILKVPAGTVAAYRAAAQWQAFTNIVGVGTPVCEITAGGTTTQYADIADAIFATPYNTQTTIKLLTDITKDVTGQSFQIKNKKITFDLNGKNLIFTTTSYTGWTPFILQNSNIDYINAGTFQIKVTGDIALYIAGTSPSTCKLTNVETTGSSTFAIQVDPAGSTLVVSSNVTATGSPGVCAYGSNVKITINGNVTADRSAVGVYGSGSSITVNGNVTSNNEGVIVTNGGTATINGTITAPTYISINVTPKTASQYTVPTTQAGYLTYTDGTSTVWVKYQSVTNISGVPSTAAINTMLTLTGTVEPAIANAKTIVWSLVNAGTTNASVSGNTFFAPATGVAFLLATIKDGKDIGTDYTQNFTITVGTTGIDDVQADNLKIYPNPVRDELKIDGDVPFDNLPFTIYNLAGQQIVNGQWQNGKSINVANLASGVYFVKITTDKGTVTRKFVKE